MLIHTVKYVLRCCKVCFAYEHSSFFLLFLSEYQISFSDDWRFWMETSWQHLFLLFYQKSGKKPVSEWKYKVAATLVATDSISCSIFFAHQRRDGSFELARIKISPKNYHSIRKLKNVWMREAVFQSFFLP